MSFKQAAAYLSKNSLRLFYMFLGAAVLLRILDDVMLGRWGIHTGEIFPYRHPGYFPLYGLIGLAVEWFLLLLGGFLLFTQHRRKGALLAGLGILMSLTQMMQNQKILLLIVLWTTALTSLETNISARKFLKWQIILVYAFSALSKIFDQFISGETLRSIALLQSENGGIQGALWHLLLNPQRALLMSYVVVFLEIVLPFLFIRKKEWAWPLVLVLHGGFLLMMRDLAAFSFAMFALAALFYCPDVTIKEEDLTQPVSEPG